LNIVKECIKQNIFEIKISRSEPDWLLVYVEKNNNYKNLIIDEDGDVSFIEPSNLKVTGFFRKEKLNYSEIVGLLK